MICPRSMCKVLGRAGIVLLMSVPIRAQAGHSGASFLELGIGARGMGMGGAYAAVANDASAFYWNPAGVSTVGRTEVSGMYASLYRGLAQHFHLGITRPLPGSAAVAVNWIRLSVADIPRRGGPDSLSTYADRVAGISPLTFSALGFSDNHDDALFISFSKLNKFNVDLGWQYFQFPVTIPVGFNIKFIRQSLFGARGSGVGFDFGTMLRVGLSDLLSDNRLGSLSFGMAVRDIFNTKISWDSNFREKGRIPRSWQFALSYAQLLNRINGRLIVAYALETRNTISHNIGVEYLYFRRLAFRFGLSHGRFSGGMGVKVSSFRIDYAFLSHDLGGSHRINTSLQF